VRRLRSNHPAQRTEIARQYRVNEFYDVVAPNGLIIGAVKYGFFNGTHWCFSIRLANGSDCHGIAPTEYGDFDMQYAPAPWQAPVVQRPQAAPEPKVTHRRDAEALLCLPKGEKT
jgi:hypothetical protein